ncbi:MAG TPA: hypothetical protein VH208_13310 [Myxococcaceae bacterium]|nr:hypothetical protein [Myxococcaceae bacterium]
MATTQRGRGRPRRKPADPTKSYLVTTFRMNRVTVAQADVIKELLALGSRTNAIQHAVAMLFHGLEEKTGLPRRRLEAMVGQKLDEQGRSLSF